MSYYVVLEINKNGCFRLNYIFFLEYITSIQHFIAVVSTVLTSDITSSLGRLNSITVCI